MSQNQIVETPKSLIYILLSRLFCSHDYHLVNQFEIKSEYDIVEDSGRTPNSYCSLKRKYIWDYKCSKCQKMKRLENVTAH
jgi:hypothetical protein